MVSNFSGIFSGIPYDFNDFGVKHFLIHHRLTLVNVMIFSKPSEKIPHYHPITVTNRKTTECYCSAIANENLE